MKRLRRCGNAPASSLAIFGPGPTAASGHPACSTPSCIDRGSVRNSVGFDWHPETTELWFTDNGRDMLGDDLPIDELNHACRPGMHFGYPYCHQGYLPDPQFAVQRKCAEFTPPVVKLGPHVASLGMRFYTGSMFPAESRNNVFVAEHGSWNRGAILYDFGQRRPRGF